MEYTTFYVVVERSILRESTRMRNERIILVYIFIFINNFHGRSSAYKSRPTFRNHLYTENSIQHLCTKYCCCALLMYKIFFFFKSFPHKIYTIFPVYLNVSNLPLIRVSVSKSRLLYIYVHLYVYTYMLCR